VSEGARLTHVDESGNAKMVDVSDKPPVRRTARARGRIRLSPETIARIRENTVAKGDVLTVARIAGITGGKRTSDLIPLCHLIEIDAIGIELALTDDGVTIESTARCTGKTGIEMEALTAVSIAALTIYDMCKAIDRAIEIREIRLIAKTKSAYDRPATRPRSSRCSP
jgi:cyclic pyranopterin phosphate synthase